MLVSIFLHILLYISGAAQHITQEGEVRLVAGRVEESGTVLVYVGAGDGHAHWGAVCDDGWNLAASHVVCQQLGYARALGYTTAAYFGKPEQDIVLDDLRCTGLEASLLACAHSPVGQHDCDKREAAGVYCDPASQTTPPPPQHPSNERPVSQASANAPTIIVDERDSQQVPAPDQVDSIHANSEDILKLMMESKHTDRDLGPLKPYAIRLLNGRAANEGRVEVKHAGRWAAICSDHWTLLEAAVVCAQTENGYASMAVQTNSFGGEDLDKVFGGVKCRGTEANLSLCIHEQIEAEVMCSNRKQVAGVVCSPVLPDLVPNATLLHTSAYLEDRHLAYMTCAMEEGCAASGAYKLRDNVPNWQHHRRRLLRFSSSTWNFGTAEFRPYAHKALWEWHQCHRHYHSMEVFAHYDLLDQHQNKVAEGHKASFCLEDVECQPGRRKRFRCQAYSDQGISVGCADNYLHDIDCQWIDITDVKEGNYTFRVHINPENRVAELSYENNAASCRAEYTGSQIFFRDCKLGMTP